MSEETALEALAVEVPEEEADEASTSAEPVRRLPAVGHDRQIEPLGEVRTAALVAAGGVVAGAATVAVVRAVKGARAARAQRKRRNGRRELGRVVASRSFLVDVHLLNR